MLIEFKIRNYYSFKDLNTLSMVAIKSYKEEINENTIELDGENRLLKTAVLYGNNASGKSNFLNALAYMKEFIRSSFNISLSGPKEFPYQKFILNSYSESEPTFFEVTFIKDGVKYRYGFELSKDKVVSEYLYHTTSKEVYLFKRELQAIKVNKNAFSEGEGKELSTKENVLFLTLCAQLNGALSGRLLDWFRNCNVVAGINDVQYSNFTTNKLKKDKDFLNWVSTFVKFLEISSVSVLDKENRDSKEELTSIITYHSKYNENNILIGSIPFELDFQESEGTKKLLYLLGPWFDTLRNGKVLWIDEMDSRLHTTLTKNLINFFHKYNQRNAQLVISTHDVNLLKNDLFRRDQIWFVEKNQFGESEIFSLADFKSKDVRGSSDFEKNYLAGKYGAVPYFDVDANLVKSIYGEKE